MSQAMNYIRAGLLILAVLLAYDTATTIMNGNLESGLTPGWVGVATSHPTLFGIGIVVLAAVFGKPFIEALGNW